MQTSSYYPNYYSIDDLFVTQESIPCYMRNDFETITNTESLDSTINIPDNLIIEHGINTDSRSYLDRNNSDFLDRISTEGRDSINTVTPGTSNFVSDIRTPDTSGSLTSRNTGNSSMNLSGLSLVTGVQIDRRRPIVAPKERQEIVDYPLWSLLYVNDSIPTHDVLLSHIYKDTFKEICDADANAINLSKINSHFYEFGRYLIGYGEQENIGDIITGTCRQRLKTLKNICYESGVQLTGNDLKKEHSEKLLFQSGCKTIQMFEDWLVDRPVGIAASSMVINHKKRKREEDLTVANTKRRSNE